MLTLEVLLFSIVDIPIALGLWPVVFNLTLIDVTLGTIAFENKEIYIKPGKDAGSFTLKICTNLFNRSHN